LNRFNNRSIEVRLVSRKKNTHLCCKKEKERKKHKSTGICL